MKINNINCLSIVIIFVIASLYQSETNNNIGKCIYIVSDSTIISFHHLKSLLKEDK